MSDLTALTDALDAKQAAILGAAFTAFLRYGVKRSSMEDIAKGAGMSRAALYLHFRNKDDIYRRLIEVYYDHAAQALATALRVPGPLEQVMVAAFRTKGGPVMEELFASPHAMEFLGYKAELGPEATSEGDAKLVGVLAEWLDEAQAAGRVKLQGPADETARVIVAALMGLHKSARSYDAYLSGLTLLGQMFGRALDG